MWDGTGTYRAFAEKHLQSLGGSLERGSDSLRLVAGSVGINIDWKKITPEVRLEFVRSNLVNATRNALETLDEERDIKRGLPNPKRGNKKWGRLSRKKKKKKKNSEIPEQPFYPSPEPVSPEPESEETVVVEEAVPLKPPSPRPQESPPPAPPKKKEKWDSRVGYFVSLSDVRWYTETPKIQESRFVDFHFDELPEQYLRLSPGQEWKSDWQQTGVLRGLNVDVVGKHKLNFSKNGDFEQ